MKAVAAALAIAMLGCAKEDPTKLEADRLLYAIDAAIAADESRKDAALAGIEAAPCSDADVCAAKTACLETFRPMAHAAALRRDVSSAIDAGVVLDPSGLRAKLEWAEAENKKAKENVDACLAAATKIRTRHGL